MLRPLLLCLILAAAVVPPASAQKSVWTREDSTRLLDKPAAFPQLPAAVRADLTRRGCRIPRASGPDVSASAQTHPNNVLAGAFFGRGHHDWAVLCSIADTSRILVYADNRAARVDSLAKTGDAIFVAQEQGHARGFYRQLDAATPQVIRSLSKESGDVVPRPLDHLGLNDYFAGKASTIYYFHRGRWRAFQGWD